MTAKLAVLGSPISHSKSPLLHRAAYRVLRLDWQYEAVDVTGATLPDFVASLSPDWRGLSLTMPLKRDVLPLLDSLDATATLTGAANTVRLAGGRHGFNTDVYGITEALRTHGVTGLDRAVILGGGATAASALVAVHRLGATRVALRLRDPAKSGLLEGLAAQVGIALTVEPLESASPEVPDAVISTLPGHAEHNVDLAPAVRDAVLFDVAYDPWPSRLARDWHGPVISGLEMLTLQALAQVRVFVNGDPDAVLDDEPAVLAAMRAAVAV